MIKLCIFDLDGTLLNTLTDLANAGNYALRACGFPEHPVERYRTFVGNGIPKLIWRILPENERTDENLAKVRQLFDTHYAAHSADFTCPYEGINELLQSLTEMGMPFAVWSNKADGYAKEIVASFFPQFQFAEVRGQKDGVPTKPDAAGGLEILKVCNVTADETLMIGDSNVDIRSAQSIQCHSVGVTWGFRSAEELTEAGAEHLISHPSELIPLLTQE